MFKNTKAFSGFSVDDLQKAKQFYTEVLGMETADNPMGILELKIAGGNHILVYPKPNHQPATYTILNFPVPNIDDAVDALTKKGVAFEHYDMGQLKTDPKGIARSSDPNKGPNIAWFKDPAGNILSVLEQNN
jgi:catechol 2,3-dioxygenase-like lactoylglutathione lyase family enzyme